MEALQQSQWFTEIFNGTAISYELKERCVEEQTPYQKIEIVDTLKFGKLMVIDGCVMLTARDNFLYHEMMSHTPLFCHPNPKQVVIVGGGDCGTLKEVLRHDTVERVQQVEIDERVTRLAEEHFPELCESNDDPRAELYFQDAIQWMREAEAGTFDVIIVDSTDPVGPGEGLFNKAFYQSCFDALNNNGILIHQSESPILQRELIRAMSNAMQQAGFQQRHTIYFPQPCYPSGWWTATMAAKGNIDLKSFREEDAKSKSFETKYYSDEIHQACLVTPPFMK